MKLSTCVLTNSNNFMTFFLTTLRTLFIVRKIQCTCSWNSCLLHMILNHCGFGCVVCKSMEQLLEIAGGNDAQQPDDLTRSVEDDGQTICCINT